MKERESSEETLLDAMANFFCSSSLSHGDGLFCIGVRTLFMEAHE